MPYNNIKLGTDYSKAINKNTSVTKSKKSTIEKDKKPIKLKNKDHKKKTSVMYIITKTNAKS